MNVDIINLLLGFIGGSGLVTVATIPAIIKKAKAEARAAEIENAQKAAEARSKDIENAQKAADEWTKIANERQEEIEQLKAELKEKNTHIDTLYGSISIWRDKYNEKCEEVTALKVYKATNEVKICVRRGCGDREPQSGY